VSEGDTNAGNTWSRPLLPGRCRVNVVAGTNRSMASSRSDSEPLPVSINATPAGGMRNKDMTQPVAAVAAELVDHLSDIGFDWTSTGTQLRDIRIHFPIISGNVLNSL
jgi:hypothetical protein